MNACPGLHEGQDVARVSAHWPTHRGRGEVSTAPGALPQPVCSYVTIRRCPSPGEMAAPSNSNSPGRVSAHFDDSVACPPPPPSPCGDDDCQCSCCTADGCLDASEGTFTSGDGASCSAAECAKRFFQCRDPTSLGAGDSNTATILDVTPCVPRPPPPPCGSDDCECRCCSGAGCPDRPIAELPTYTFNAGHPTASQHGPTCPRSQQQPMRPPTTREARPLAQGCPVGPRGAPLPLGCRREAVALRTERRRFHRP